MNGTDSLNALWADDKRVLFKSGDVAFRTTGNDYLPAEKVKEVAALVFWISDTLHSNPQKLLQNNFSDIRYFNDESHEAHHCGLVEWIPETFPRKTTEKRYGRAWLENRDTALSGKQKIHQAFSRQKGIALVEGLLPPSIFIHHSNIFALLSDFTMLLYSYWRNMMYCCIIRLGRAWPMRERRSVISQALSWIRQEKVNFFLLNRSFPPVPFQDLSLIYAMNNSLNGSLIFLCFFLQRILYLFF